MAVRSILRYPDARLTQVAAPVAQIDQRLAGVIADMFETMYDAKGIGLAATQIDVHERLIVIDVSEERNEPMVLINPELVWQSAERVKGDEGCLSVPGFYDGVERAAEVRVRATDRDGSTREIAAGGLLAVCIQHEMDHLMGKVFVEYLSPLKKSRIRAKLQKAERERAQDRAQEPA